MNKQSPHKNGGYTLLELLIAIAIILILVPAITLAIRDLYRMHAGTISSAFALVEASKGMKEIVRDIRSSVYAENGSAPIVAIATSSLTLYADTDFDGRVERVRYFINAGSLKKGIIEPTSTSSYPISTETISTLVPVVKNATTSLFSFFTATGTPVTTTSQMVLIRRVEVQLIGAAKFGSKESQVSLRSSASIRNLKETM